VACTLDLIGDKWTLLVIRDLMFGKAHFKEFVTSPERVATNILAQRLSRLSGSGLIERYPSDVYPGREAYRLTAKGHSLRPLLEQMAAWGLEHIEGTSARLKAAKFFAPST
jgi:DNA-binding HxlR family transcriptional regulator